jgi:hypothetical protein
MSSAASSYSEYLEIVNTTATVKWKNHFHDLSCLPTSPDHAQFLCSGDAKIPLPRDCHSTAQLTPNACFLHGGWVRMGPEGDQEFHFDDLWCWNLSSCKWTQAAPSGVPRFSHVAQFVRAPGQGLAAPPKQLMLVLGGMMNEKVKDLRPMAYDPAKNLWLTPVSVLRSSTKQASSFNYDALDSSGDSARSSPRAPPQEQFRHYRRPLPRRSFFSSVVYNDLVVCYGGLDPARGSGTDEDGCWDTVLCLNLVTADSLKIAVSDDDDDGGGERCGNLVAVAWDPAPTGKGPGPRFGHSACECNGKMYLYGGTTQKRDVDDGFYSLDLSTFVWSWIDVLDSPPCRFLHSMLQASADAFIVFGGRHVEEDTSVDCDDPEMYIFSVTRKQWRCFVSHEGPFPKTLCSSTIVVCKPHDDDEGLSALVIAGELQDDCTNAVVEMKISRSELETAFETPATTGDGTEPSAVESDVYEEESSVASSLQDRAPPAGSSDTTAVPLQTRGANIDAPLSHPIGTTDIVSSADSTGRRLDHRSVSANSLPTESSATGSHAPAEAPGSVGPSSGVSHGAPVQGLLLDMTAQTSSVHSALLSMMQQLHHLVGFRLQEVEQRLDETNRRVDRLRDAVLGIGSVSGISSEQRVVNAMLLDEIRGLRFQIAAALAIPPK